MSRRGLGQRIPLAMGKDLVSGRTDVICLSVYRGVWECRNLGVTVLGELRVWYIGELYMLLQGIDLGSLKGRESRYVGS